MVIMCFQKLVFPSHVCVFIIIISTHNSNNNSYKNVKQIRISIKINQQIVYQIIEFESTIHTLQMSINIHNFNAAIKFYGHIGQTQSESDFWNKKETNIWYGDRVLPFCSIDYF